MIKRRISSAKESIDTNRPDCIVDLPKDFVLIIFRQDFQFDSFIVIFQTAFDLILSKLVFRPFQYPVAILDILRLFKAYRFKGRYCSCLWDSCDGKLARLVFPDENGFVFAKLHLCCAGVYPQRNAVIQEGILFLHIDQVKVFRDIIAIGDTLEFAAAQEKKHCDPRIFPDGLKKDVDDGFSYAILPKNSTK